MDIKAFSQVLRECDLLVARLIDSQEILKNHKWYGGVKDKYGIHNLKDTAVLIRSAACSYMMPKSKYYRSAILVEKTELAMRYLLESQYDAGTTDIHHTIFYSAPNLAFALEKLCAAYHILNRENRLKYVKVREMLKEYILKSGETLLNGGIHTPNHRWVICMALAWIHHLFPNEKYIKRIDEWLNEGVDIDPDGQFSEKSTAVYSPLCCRCFIAMAKFLDRPELYEYVRKNLDMTVYLMHPNGEIDTMTSRRQDKDRLSNMTAYYYPYRYMAIKDKNPLYSAMAWKIMNGVHELQFPSYLILYLSDPLMRDDMPPPTEMSEKYEKILKYSNSVRIRNRDKSVTVASNQSGIISIHKGNAILRKMRLASAFFGEGQFVGDKIVKEGGRYVLKQHLKSSYYQPLPKEYNLKNGDWDKMDHSKRAEGELCELNSTVTVEDKNNVLNVSINIEGTDNVPVAVEMGFKKGGQLSGVEKVKDIDNAYLLANGYGKYVYGENVIEFGPGHVAHSWTQLRGALPKMDADCVYLTGITPFNITIEIK